MPLSTRDLCTIGSYDPQLASAAKSNIGFMLAVSYMFLLVRVSSSSLHMLYCIDRCGIPEFRRKRKRGATANKASGRGCDLVTTTTAATDAVQSKTVSSITVGRGVKSTCVANRITMSPPKELIET